MVMTERNMLVMLNFTLQSDGAGRMEYADGAIFDEDGIRIVKKSKMAQWPKILLFIVSQWQKIGKTQ